MKISLLFILFLVSCSPKKYDAKIYHEFAEKNFRHYENSITVNIIPTTYRLDWSKPRNLIWSLLKNQHFFSGTKHFIGHVTTEVNCKTENGVEREFIGQTSAEKGGFEKYLAQGYGFSILNRPQNKYDYPLLTVKGRLDDEQKVFEEYARFVSEGLMSVMSLEITADNCQRALAYIREYKTKTSQTQNAGNVYGFGADPKRFEGAGCAPMVQTVLEVAGASEVAKAMNKTVYVPKSLIGNPKQNKKVSIWDLVLADIDISKQTKDSVEFTFPDPQGLMDFFNEKKRREEAQFLAFNLKEGRAISSQRKL